MVSQWIFTGFILLLALQRAVELRWSRRNEARIRAAGGQESAPWQLGLMKVLHTAWFLAMLLEVHWLDRPFIQGLSLAAFLLFIAGQSLRYAAIQALGWRWTVSVMVIPGADPVRQGAYRYIRHPNYLGVILEIFAVPLLHSAYLTAILFSIANGLLLLARIRAEEKALYEYNGYERLFKGHPRFFPRVQIRK